MNLISERFEERGMRIFFAPLIILLGFTFAFNGCAARLDEMDAQMKVLQKRTAALETKGGMPIASDKELLDNQRLADVRSQVAAMRNEITVLSGKVEAMEYENKNLVAKLDDALKDVDAKLSEIEKLKQDMGQRSQAPAVSGGGSGDSGEPEAQYNAALRLHQDGKFEESNKLFDSFVKSNPRHSYADNALYWIGDALIQEKQFRKAITRFQDLIEKYPKSDKRCDALGKQIVALKELKMTKEAAAFTQVRNAECSQSKTKR